MSTNLLRWMLLREQGYRKLDRTQKKRPTGRCLYLDAAGLGQRRKPPEVVPPGRDRLRRAVPDRVHTKVAGDTPKRFTSARN